MSRIVGFHLLLAASLVAMPAMASAAATPAPAPSASAAASPAAAAMSSDQAHQLALNVLLQLQNGRIDRSMFTSQMNDQLTDANLLKLAPELSPIGQPYTTLLSTKDEGGGMTTFVFWLHSGQGAFDETITVDKDGKVANFNIVRDTLRS